jgi:hypothetical protein
VKSVVLVGSKLVAASASASFTLDRSAATNSGRGYCSADGSRQVQAWQGQHANEESSIGSLSSSVLLLECYDSACLLWCQLGIYNLEISQ